jgi:FixJ family two-component response regulator
VGTSAGWARTGELNELTPRERDVARGIIDGRTNREVANDPGLTKRRDSKISPVASTPFTFKSGLRLSERS